MEYYLFKAYRELLKIEGPNWSLYDGGGFHSETFTEIVSALTGWPFGVEELVDQDNWNFANLQEEDGVNWRGPRAYFDLSITSRGNLALDWYPTKPFQRNPNLKETDWTRWDSAWRQGDYLPFNRVFMIRGFNRLLFRFDGKTYDKIDEYLFEAIDRLITTIYTFLSYFIEAEEVTKLYLEYQDVEEHQIRRIKRKFIGAEIRMVEEVERERAVKKKLGWISDRCQEFGISPQEFLEIFKTNEMKYAPTARQISTETANLSPNRVKKLVCELYDFPEIYDPVLSQAPPGVKPRRKRGEVIKVDFKR